MGITQSSSPCLLSRLRGHAHRCKWLTACQPVPECWLPILFVGGLVVSPHLFPVRCQVTSPHIHMSHPVSVVSTQGHNVFIGLLDHGDKVRARILFSSQTAVLLPPTTSGLQVSCASPLVSTTVVSCRSQPFAPPVSSNTWLIWQVR